MDRRRFLKTTAAGGALISIGVGAAGLRQSGVAGAAGQGRRPSPTTDVPPCRSTAGDAVRQRAARRGHLRHGAASGRVLSASSPRRWRHHAAARQATSRRRHARLQRARRQHDPAHPPERRLGPTISSRCSRAARTPPARSATTQPRSRSSVRATRRASSRPADDHCVGSGRASAGECGAAALEGDARRRSAGGRGLVIDLKTGVAVRLRDAARRSDASKSR